MARLLALEWDAREVRVASAVTRGADVVVEQAFAIPRADTSATTTAADEDIGPLVSAALAERDITSMDTLVGVGRSSIELRVMNLPPSPPEEQPDLVRFQATQAFAAIGDDWPLDFVPIDSHDDSVTVLAAAVSPKMVQQIREICESGGLRPERLLLRPFAAASLLDRSDVRTKESCCLMVDLLADEADLTVLFRGQVVFMRTVRLPSGKENAVQDAAILGELRRTIGAAQNQLAGQRVEQVVICGGEGEYRHLQEAIESKLALDVVTFDPFEAVKLHRDLKRARPEPSGRFAPLLGMLVDEGAGAAHAIDFLNPRRRPQAPSQSRRNVTVGSLAAVVLLLGALGVWIKLRSLDGEIRGLQVATAEMNEAVAKAEELVSRANAVREFENGDITWLDELSEVAKRLPDAEQTILKEVTVGAHSPTGGIMTLKGNVRESADIAEFEESLRYGENVVAGRQGSVDTSQKDYPWVLDTTVIVPPDRFDNGHSLGRPVRQEVVDTTKPGDAENKAPVSGEDNDVDSAETVDGEELVSVDTQPDGSASEPQTEGQDQ
jgi:Tfp pilus assembly PilM family ATPase